MKSEERIQWIADSDEEAKTIYRPRLGTLQSQNAGAKSHLRYAGGLRK